MFYDARIILFVIFFYTISAFPQLQPKQNRYVKDFRKEVISRSSPQSISRTKTTEVSQPTSLRSTASTIVFEESFEGTTGFPPTGWKTINADGGGLTGPWFQGNTSIFASYSGNGYAAANYQGANEFYIDEWLISPNISSISLNDTLSFWHRSPDYSPYDDSIEVRISTTNSDVASFVIKADYFITSTSGWAQKRYPLINYVPAGSNIYIAFRYLIYNGGISGISSDYVGIDLVQIVRQAVSNDLKAVSIDFPYNKGKIQVGQSFEPLATFENVGSSAQSSVSVRFRIIPPSGETYEDNQTITSLNPAQSIQISFSNYAPSVTGIHAVRAYSLLTGDQNTSNDSTSLIFSSSVLLTGTFTVGSGGDIQTLKGAVDTLNNNIVAGDITFSLMSSSYAEPPLSIGTLDYLYGTNRITFKPSSGISPVININSTPSQPYGITIFGTSNVTIDGSNSGMHQRNSTINAVGVDGKIGILIEGAEESYADSNTIKNMIIRTGADSQSSSEGYYGVLLYGFNSTYKDAANKISNCDITRHGAVGIAAQWQTGAVIENNFIHDWLQQCGVNDVHGIWLADGTINTTVNGNIIGNLKTRENYSWAYGIENSSGTGSNTLVYNNIIYNILSYGVGTNANCSRGIYGSSITNSGDGYYYNSIYLSGTDSSASASSRTAGFEFVGGTNITMKNNIIFNESSLLGSSSDNKAYCVYLSSVPTNFLSNNNDFYAPGAQGVVGYNGGNKASLADWRASFLPAQDILSISSDPMFINSAAGNLHIQTSVVSPVNGAGLPVVEISYDIDRNFRNLLTPDIGADEFTPGEFVLNVEYNTGWNLVSVPIIASDYRVASLFPSAISDVFSYNGNYVAETTLVNGAGYWIKFGSPTNNEFAGSSLTVDTIDVDDGWNIIGSVSYPISVSNITQIPPNIVVSAYFEYNDGYMETDTLEPGRGYWVKVNQNGKLILRVP